LQSYDVGASWWRSFYRPHPVVFILLILAGLDLEYVIHYHLGIAIVYTQFYYLIIVVAGLWYGRKAIWIALLFGGLHVIDAYILTSVISPDAVMRGLMMLIVAFVIGTIVDQMHCYYDRATEQNRVLADANEKMHSLNTQLAESQEAFQIANKKLNLLTSVTRHDINNQLSVLQGYLILLEKTQHDPSLNEYFQKATTAAQRISTMVQFTKEYENIGVNAPAWHNCRNLVDTAAKQVPLGNIIVKNDFPAGAEAFADPLIVKVFYNLIDNAVRYGEKITTIRFSLEESNGAHVVVCEDDGEGIPADEKERIFERGFGKNTGLGLFLAREILAITGMTIREIGEPCKGARFEITVPHGSFRILT